MSSAMNKIRTTHAGSLPRPTELTALYAARAKGETVDEAEITRLGQQSAERLINRQVEIGMDIVNDGEQMRESFFFYVQRRMSGFGGTGLRSFWRDIALRPDFQAKREEEFAARTFVSHMAPPANVGPVAYTDPDAVAADCRLFTQALTKSGHPAEGAFLTAPSPGIIAAAIPNGHYDTQEAYIRALATALKTEYTAIVEAGYTLQIDAPDLAMERHISFADQPLSVFLDFVAVVIDAINQAIADLPREKMRLHVCWGNYEGPHDLDVPLEDVIPVIARANVSGFLLPMGNPRHGHEWRVFEKPVIADDQSVIVGCVDTTTNMIEHPQVIADRIERVARALGDPSRVLAATDCGFDTSAGAGRAVESVVWSKLESLVEGARLASKELF